MTASPEPAAHQEQEELAFDRAEFAAAEDAAPSCALCKRALGRSYFTINGAIACEDCHHLVSSQLKESKGARAFLRAAGFGAAAAVGGSVAWYAVARITGMEIGLLAIAVGYAVGKAVRYGARGPGARRYQALAMLLTYLSITGSYVPLVWKGVTEVQNAPPAAAGAAAAVTPAASGAAPASITPGDEGHTTSPATPPTAATPPSAAPGAESLVRLVLTCIVVLALSLVAPFLGGASNILGIILIGIALWEAWKFNRPVKLLIDGPLRTHSVAPVQRAVTAPPAEG